MRSTLEVNDYTPMKRRRLWKGPIGNHIGIIFTSLGIPLLTLGPHYLYFILSFFTSLIIQSLFLLSCYHLLETPQKIAIWSSFILSISSLLYSGLINPGIKTGQNLKQNEILKVFNDRSFCRVCEVVRDLGCIHCTECDLCIDNRKFHSIVIGKCIGAKNLYSYYTWVGASILTFSQVILAICVSI